MKAIITDVDDTICPSTKPASKEMVYQIERLVDAGLIFSFISGGTVKQIADQLGEVTREIHILGGSGTHYIKKIPLTPSLFKFEEIYKYTLLHDQKVEILNAFEKLIEKFDIKTLTTKDDQLQDRDTQITLSALGRHAPDHLKRAFDPTGEKRIRWIEYLESILEYDYDIRIGGTTSIDVNMKGSDKRAGIKAFLDANNLRHDDAVFFGDKIFPGGNDHGARFIVDCFSVKNDEETLGILKCIKPSYNKDVYK